MVEVWATCGCLTTAHPGGVCSRYNFEQQWMRLKYASQAPGADDLTGGAWDNSLLGPQYKKRYDEMWADTARRRVAELEEALARSNRVAAQAWEIAEQRGRRIMELQAEIDALKAKQSPPVDAVEFPVNALRWSK